MKYDITEAINDREKFGEIWKKAAQELGGKLPSEDYINGQFNADEEAKEYFLPDSAIYINIEVGTNGTLEQDRIGGGDREAVFGSASPS